MLNDTIVLQLQDDSTPEEREEYRVILTNVQTKGKIQNHDTKIKYVIVCFQYFLKYSRSRSYICSVKPFFSSRCNSFRCGSFGH